MQSNLITRLSLIASFTLAISACIGQSIGGQQQPTTPAAHTEVQAPPATSDTPEPVPTQPGIHQLVINHDADLSGNIGSGGQIFHLEVAGDRSNNVTSQAFLTFKLHDLPPGVTIIEVGLDFSDFIVNGDPFGDLGCLRAYIDRFEKVDSVDYVVSATEDYFFQWCSESELANQHRVQTLIDVLPPEDDPTSFQVRLQFENSSDEDGRIDAIEIYRAFLLVVYLAP